MSHRTTLLPTDPRRARHQETKAKIINEAWALAQRDGIGGISLGDLGKAVGLRQPSLYTYFDSKADLYGAMFADGNQQLLAAVTQREYPPDPRAALKEIVRAIVAFVSEDITRAQLLFQRPIPDFKPSKEAYAPAVEFYAWIQQRLTAAGVTLQEDLDIFTALVAGLSDQQAANDPGGDRWLQVVDEAIDMFLDHIEAKREQGR